MSADNHIDEVDKALIVVALEHLLDLRTTKRRARIKELIEKVKEL